jgi:hypothetical protein
VVSIFIQISAYRDQELFKTIQNAIDQSSGQYKLVFGVHEVVSPEDSVLEPDFEAEVRILTSIAPENLGVNAGRHLANSLYDGEDYYYQIDSHMRFVQNWDAKAIADIKHYQRNGIAKPLLTMYPGNYWYKDGVEEFDVINYFMPTKVVFSEKPEQFESTLIASQLATTTTVDCAYTFSVSAANIFTLGEFANLPRDTRIMFWGEELLTAATAFCYGFDLVVPTNHLVWHLYYVDQNAEQARRTHAWQDYPDEWQALVKASEGALEESLFGLRGERSLDDFGRFAGLNFNTRKLADHQLVK